MGKFKRALSLLLKGRFDVIVLRIASRFNKQIFLPILPPSITIEPINVCNLHCPTCPTGSGMLKRKKCVMSYDNFKKIMDQIKGHVYYLGLFFMGEPFLNKDILKFVNYASLAGIDTEISTNGQFFTSIEFAREVVKSGLSHLIICFDGVDQETVAEYRIGADFEKIKKGLFLIKQAKRELNSKKPTIEIQFILMKQNEHQREVMKNLVTSWDVDIYCEKTMGLMGSCEDEENQKLGEKYLPVDLSGSRYYRKDNGKFALKGEMPDYCPYVYETLLITAEGHVVPCCYDVDADNIMGNVFQENLKTIWKNKKYSDFRKKIKTGRKSIPICNTCSVARYETLHKEKA